MLDQVTLENFKAFKAETVAPIRKITLIYGPNSGGKSSLIHSLALLKQSFRGPEDRISPLVFSGQLVDLGTFTNVVHNHSKQEQIKVGLRYHPPGKKSGQLSHYLNLKFAHISDTVDLPTDSYVSGLTYGLCTSSGEVDLSLSIGQRSYEAAIRKHVLEGKPFQPKYKVRGSLNNDFLDLLTSEKEETTGKEDKRLLQLLEFIKQFNLETAREQNVGKSQVKFSGKAEDVKRLLWTCSDKFLPTMVAIPDHTYEKDVEDWSALAQLVGQFVSRTRSGFDYHLERLSYLGPLRQFPERFYQFTGAEESSVGARGEYTGHRLYLSENLRQRINGWFQRFGLGYEVEARRVSDVETGILAGLRLVDTHSKIVLAPNDVGFGISQLLPIMVEAHGPQTRILAVEQPELHLHPRLQGQLADFLLDSAGIYRLKDSEWDDEPSRQWIVETHSEAIATRLIRRFREASRDGKPINPDDIAVLYVNPLPTGESQLTRIRLDEDGRFLDKWPNGFFEEPVEDLFSSLDG